MIHEKKAAAADDERIGQGYWELVNIKQARAELLCELKA
jgi:hypothetical protein